MTQDLFDPDFEEAKEVFANYCGILANTRRIKLAESEHPDFEKIQEINTLLYSLIEESRSLYSENKELIHKANSVYAQAVKDLRKHVFVSGNAFSLSKEQNKKHFDEVIKPLFLETTREASKPKFILVGGQSGVGKSKLSNRIQYALKKTTVVIDADDFRPCHPHHEEMMQCDSEKVFERARDDVNIWLLQAGQWAAKNRRNVIMDGTLREKDNVMQAVNFFKSHGYTVELNVIATHERYSHANILCRELATGRFVDTDFHKKAYDAIPETVKLIEESKLVDRINIVNRTGESVYENTLTNGTWAKKAEAVHALQTERGRLPFQTELDKLESMRNRILSEMELRQFTVARMDKVRSDFEHYRQENFSG